MNKIILLLCLFIFSFTPNKDNLVSHSYKESVIDHKYFIVCYDTINHVPYWVSYKLTARMVNHKDYQHEIAFRTDTSNKALSPSPRDYTNSGYDRGQLVPAEDMEWLLDASRKAYLMTNIAPQDHLFNKGIWQRLEDQTRKWAVENEEVYVTTGAITTDQCLNIANGKIAVPTYFYKIILDNSGPQIKIIAFLMKNENSDLPITSFVTTVDAIESMTGYDFYPELSNELEASQDTTGWHF